jgi:THO complex subunit 2
MAGPGGKRKRGDRTYSQDSSNGGSRPSPYAPEGTTVGRQLREQDYRNNRQYGEQRGGGRRGRQRGSGHDGGRGGPVGRGEDRNRRSPSDGVNTVQSPTKSSPTIPNAMSPPPVIQSKFQESIRRPTTPLETSSQQAAVQQASPTNAKQSNVSTEIVPQAEPPFYSWEYLTYERICSWRVSGRQQVVDIGIEARQDEDPMALSVMFQEILKSGLDKRIDAADAGAVIKDILGKQDETESERQAFDAPTLFLDTLSVFTDSDVSHPLLPEIVKSTEVSTALMRLVLESPLLQALGLVRPTFDKVFVRTQTNLLYRQSKYNLLREESEGYSKLITELFTTSNEPPSSEIVGESFERVKALVGAFDLDVGRVLDVTLDVFAAVLVKQFRFFVKLLRASSWWPQPSHFESVEMFGQTFETLPKWALPGSGGWFTTEEDKESLAAMKAQRDKRFWERVREIGLDAYFEIGGRRISPQQKAVFDNGDLEKATEADDQSWIDTTGTLPPRGNRVAAQLLGFKLRFYASSARDPADILPLNLIYLAALLIKIGFISLRDLYPHLWPEDKDMEKVKEEKLKEKAAKEKASRDATGAMNALAMAGALPDDSPPASGRLRETDGNRGAPAGKIDPVIEKPAAGTKAEEEKEKLPEPKDQKIELLKSLLCIGAIPEALFILGRFPWIPDVYPEIVDYIHRILHHSLEKVYDPLRPMGGIDIRQSRKIVDLTAMAKGETRLIDAPPRKTLRWAQMDRDDTNENIDYRFYWDDWTDNVPVCQTIDDVFSLCSTLLNTSGVKIGRDPALLFKLARIGKHSLASDPSESNAARWANLSKRLLVPSLSLSKENPGVVGEVFDLIKTFPTSTRFSIYAEWYYGATSRIPDIKSAFDLAKLESSHVLKRISKTNARSMARALAKVAYANPGIVFIVALGQIESYDNLVEVFVECGRYFTQLGYDVLTWSLLSSLGGKGRNRVQADGILTSKWLSALSLFAGKIFKRYSVMNPTPILQYVANQLEKGSAVDLIVLREVINSMAGIVMSDANITESQIQSLSGGEVLRQLTLLQLYDKRHESRSQARRLMKALTEPNLIAKLLILIAQERQTCLFKIADQDAHLKLLGNLFDEIHRVLAQYLDLLRSNLSIKEFDAIVPDVASLILDFGIEPRIAFWISRPSIVHEIKQLDKGKIKITAEPKQLQRGSESTKAIDTGKDDDTETLDRPQEENVTAPTSSDDAGKSKNDPEGDSEMKDSITTPEESTPLAVAQEPWHPVLKSLMGKIRPALPEKTWSVLSIPFYLTFWQLSLYDVSVPTKSYDEEATRLKSKLINARDDRSDPSQAGLAKKERDKKLYLETQDRLHVEMREHIRSFSETKSRLRKEKDYWFAGLWGRWDALADAIIQHCIFPRAVLSPNDAVYCFKFIKQLHIQGTLNFRTMGVIDHIFRDNRLANLIFVCTAREVENLGRFLNELLKELSGWHADKALYEKEAFGPKKDLPGFAKKLISETQVGEFLEYEDFRRILYKWHKNINNALRTCLSGGEYMHIQNAITILKSIHQVFPIVNWNGRDMLTSVTELSKKEKREDVKLAATAVLGMLKKREGNWVFPQAFNLVSYFELPVFYSNTNAF